MTFKQLRNKIANNGPQAIRWLNSSIIELATIEPNGAVRITNAISKKSYILPTHYVDLKIEIIQMNEVITLGDLMPKSMRMHLKALEGDNTMTTPSQKLDEVKDSIEQAAREIFYAEKSIKDIPAIEPRYNLKPYEYVQLVDEKLSQVLANLELALRNLGVTKPEQVGLSSRALERK